MPRYIDADKALEDFDEWCDTTGALGKGTSYYYEARSCIEDVPTADVAEVKHGEWIDLHDENVLYEQTYKCSACGEWFVIEAGTPKENGYKYCPNCGARMDGEE